MTTPQPVELAEPRRFEVKASEKRALAAVAEAAEVWGAEWSRKGRSGRLELPVNAGLRHGIEAGHIEARGSSADATDLTYRVEQAKYTVHFGSVVVLFFGGLGAVLTIIAPLFAELLWEMVPFGVILMVVAWLLVASKVRHRGIEEFFGLVTELAAAEDEPSEEEAGSFPPGRLL